MKQGAIARFNAAQSRLLHHTYDQAWVQGVAAYQPDADPEHPLPPDDGHPDVIRAVGVGAAAALLARRLRRYHPPAGPNETARAKALAPALASLNRMAGELDMVIPAEKHYQAAQVATLAGDIAPEDQTSYAAALAVSDWLDTNQWRLDAGESVAWAGEQDGYSQAADADGQLLEWLPEADDRVCEDCEALGGLPPMPLSDWPTTPGSGDTICNVGCRCVMQVSDEQLQPGENLPALNDEQEQLVDRIAESREPSAYGPLPPAVSA